MLDELNELFMDVKDAEIEYENLPDGEYLAKITNAEYKVSKSDKPMFVITAEITDGDYAGRSEMIFNMLCGKDETSLKKNLTRYGNLLKKFDIVATSINDSFEQAKNIMINKEIKLTITTNGEFTNKSIEVL